MQPATSQKPAKFLVCATDCESSRTALRLACKKAQRRGDKIDILTVIEPASFQPLFSVADKISNERREQAEVILQGLAKTAYEESGIYPTLHLREGNPGEQILAAVMEDSDINMIVLGVSPQSKSDGKLINWLSERSGDSLLVPLMLVPGNLTDQQIEALA